MLFFLFLLLICILFFISISKRTKESQKHLDRENHSDIIRNESELIGEYGEHIIHSSLKELLPGAIILNNLYIPKGYNDEYSEIDMLVLHTTGLYCFECKNYSGALFGKKNEVYWTEYFGKKGSSYKVYNPIKQNMNHIKYLKAVLPGAFRSNVFSCIAFAKNIKIPTIELDNTLCLFSNSSNLHIIKKVVSNKNQLYSEDMIIDLSKYLSSYCNISNDKFQEHKNQIIKKYDKFSKYNK